MKFLYAANRLAAINYYDTGDRTEFAYDGLGRRVKIVEYGPGVTATIQPSGSSYTTFTTAPFTLPTGSYSLTFQGLNPNGGDNIALIDSVELNSTPVANGSFESPSVTDYQANPSDTNWSYTSDSGIAHGGGTYTSTAPAGNQVAFVKNTGLLSQIWSASAGTYTLSFKAAQRGSNNDSHQQLRVNLRPSGSVSTKNFVWCGNQICEERDASNTVTKRFFNEGEKRIGGSDAGNYYYSRDHLGSIREVTDSTGALKSQYDYDAWGNSVVVSGNMNVDFGFTGHYFHQPSGMNLAMYRAYNPILARWISRDPLGESAGENLYAYSENDTLNKTDTLGLCCDEQTINRGLAQLEIAYRRLRQVLLYAQQVQGITYSCKESNCERIAPRMPSPECWKCEALHGYRPLFAISVTAFTGGSNDHWVVLCRAHNDSGAIVREVVFDFWKGYEQSMPFADSGFRNPIIGYPYNTQQ